jgi:arylsulfatase A-like enzyme
VRKKLKELGMDENTVIIYTSDHGSHFKTRNGEYKRSCHDGCLRVPMISMARVPYGRSQREPGQSD